MKDMGTGVCRVWAWICQVGGGGQLPTALCWDQAGPAGVSRGRCEGEDSAQRALAISPLILHSPPSRPPRHPALSRPRPLTPTAAPAPFTPTSFSPPLPLAFSAFHHLFSLLEHPLPALPLIPSTPSPSPSAVINDEHPSTQAVDVRAQAPSPHGAQSTAQGGPRPATDKSQ